MRKYIRQLYVFGLVSCLSIVAYNFLSELYPQILASSYMRCLSYFNLDKVPLILVDQLNSQGEDVFAFGEKTYFWGELNEKQLGSLYIDLVEKGSTESYDNACLIKKRYNIIGEFKLYRDKSPYQVTVSYKEIK